MYEEQVASHHKVKQLYIAEVPVTLPIYIYIASKHARFFVSE